MVLALSWTFWRSVAISEARNFDSDSWELTGGGPTGSRRRIWPLIWTDTPGSRAKARKSELGYLQRMKRASTYEWRVLH